MFGWLRNRRRKKILAEPLPEEWWVIIVDNIWPVAQLPESMQRRLCNLTQIFAAEKNWEGCGGLELTDEIRVTISAQASLMVLERPDLDFDHVQTVLVYPAAYQVPDTQFKSGGLVVEGTQPRMGEAWVGGPVILSWSDCLAGARGQAGAGNLTVHEFAHQLDMANDRIIDGTPPMPNPTELRHWAAVMQSEFDQLQARCRHGHRGMLDCYGTTNPGEFFAVTSEAYFSMPQLLHQHHPRLYDRLNSLYCLHPARHWSRD